MAELYLLSPEDFIPDKFAKELDQVLRTGDVAAFQLRIKNKKIAEIIAIAKQLLPIAHQNGVPFIINDYVEILRELPVDGIHLGSDDADIAKVRQEFGEELIIGASCYNSKHLAMEAGEAGASYVAFGSFFSSVTKQTNKIATPDVLAWCSSYTNLSSCAIGGINQQNIQNLKGSNVDFIAVVSAIWGQKDSVAATRELASLAAKL